MKIVCILKSYFIDILILKVQCYINLLGKNLVYKNSMYFGGYFFVILLYDFLICLEEFSLFR